MLKLMSDQYTNFSIKKRFNGSFEQMTTDAGIDGAERIVELINVGVDVQGTS